MCTGEVCRNEFTCRSFGFSWDRPTDFGFSQFGKKSLVYVIYRWLMGLYFTVSLFYGFGSYEINPWWKWLIFLTHWTFAILSIATLLGAVVALHVYLRYDGNESEKDSYDMPLAYKIYWIFHNISLNAAPVISVIYWLVVFDPEFYEINYPSVTFHAVNIGWTLVDFCFTAVPVRILHAYQAVCYGIIYGIFTLIYWQAGGTDERGNPYVYEVIDYGNDPKTAVAWIAFLIFGLICIHVVWFGLYRLRLLIYRSCGCGQVSPMEPTTRGVNHPI